MSFPSEQWIKMYDENRESRNGYDCALIWESDERAEEYLQLVQKQQKANDEKISELSLSSDMKILDIGSGPGTFTIPFAKIAKQVTAVEPAIGMRKLLLRRVDEANLTNVFCIPKRWEDVTADDLVPPYDLVFASLSLGMRDIRSAFLKMHNVCSGNVVCYWQAASGPWEKIIRELTEKISGKNYVPVGKAPLLLEILSEEKIPATLEVSVQKQNSFFPSFDAAVDETAKRLGTKNVSDKKIISKYLEDILKEENGCWMLNDTMPPMGKLSWKGGYKKI